MIEKGEERRGGGGNKTNIPIKIYDVLFKCKLLKGARIFIYLVFYSNLNLLSY